MTDPTRLHTLATLEAAAVQAEATRIHATLPVDPNAAHHRLEAYLELHLPAAIRRTNPCA